MCDCQEGKESVLVDPKGDLLNILNLDSEQFNVAVTDQNIGYITQPNTESILQIDPDRMVILHRVKSNDVCSTEICVSAVSNSGRDTPNKVPCYFGVKHYGNVYAYPVNGYNINFRTINNNIMVSDWAIDPLVVMFHAVREGVFFSCIGGQSYIKYTKHIEYAQNKEEYILKIESMDTPTDICSDNNGHVYVSGQGSNNIHRLTQDGKVLDISLDSRHGIIQPVALCFNQTIQHYTL
ncbi:unnamed protein product [Mytilus coruscus]|uniref:Uncharacterized protein n=1 Tax=Mytilus coruscus TaxID=42192 RepID=A0A6J8CM41_MYTCO|nr:unnamed protein product [Mytilus coruscus]